MRQAVSCFLGLCIFTLPAFAASYDAMRKCYRSLNVFYAQPIGRAPFVKKQNEPNTYYFLGTQNVMECKLNPHAGTAETGIRCFSLSGMNENFVGDKRKNATNEIGIDQQGQPFMTLGTLGNMNCSAALGAGSCSPLGKTESNRVFSQELTKLIQELPKNLIPDQTVHEEGGTRVVTPYKHAVEAASECSKWLAEFRGPLSGLKSELMQLEVINRVPTPPPAKQEGRN